VLEPAVLGGIIGGSIFLCLALSATVALVAYCCCRPGVRDYQRTVEDGS